MPKGAGMARQFRKLVVNMLEFPRAHAAKFTGGEKTQRDSKE
jgi:hypothetical protein